MLFQKDPYESEGCCQPGEITVTRTPTGYLLAKTMSRLGPGVWWTYITTVKNYDDALSMA